MGPRRLGKLGSFANDPTLEAAVDNVVGIWAAAARSGSEAICSPSGESVGAGGARNCRVALTEASPKRRASGIPGTDGRQAPTNVNGSFRGDCLGRRGMSRGDSPRANKRQRAKRAEDRPAGGLEASTLTITPRSSWSSQPKATSAADGGTPGPKASTL